MAGLIGCVNVTVTGGVRKVPNFSDVIYEWPLRHDTVALFMHNVWTARQSLGHAASAF